MVSAISSKATRPAYLIDDIPGVQNNPHIRQLTGATNQPTIRPLTASDSYLTARTDTQAPFLTNLIRPLTNSLMAREGIQKTYFMNVDVEGLDTRVEVSDTNPIYLPSENRTKEVIKDIMPSVARISVTGKMVDEETGESTPASWLGSGFVVDPSDLDLQGYMPEEGQTLIATNHHVANNSILIQTEFANGKKFFGPAKVLVSDEDMDIAILVIETGDTYLPPAPIGDINDIDQGEFVLTFGAPRGLPFRVTRGIINNYDFDEDEYIQTDAAINPGNSGGPLVDLSSGNVVGMNTYIFRGSNSMGFAMPIWLQFQILRDIWHEENWSWQTIS
ncbi:MAG: trypsin-like peptidase domain-containing protein [bacterium]|nr:trypsin-like peptidase domain-containing protein [bacterium]MBU1918539.1 trypsin-like peptidase domain-containing protein [bacterium]